MTMMREHEASALPAAEGDSRGELRRRYEYLAALHETALGIMDRLDLSDVLHAILVRAAELAGTPHGFAYLLEPGRDEMEVKVGLGAFRRFIGFRLGYGEGVSGKVWESGRAMLVDDYDAWAGRSPRFERDVFKAVVAVPLTSGSEVVGVIGVAHIEPGRRFAPDMVELMTGFAQLASIALDNARLYSEAREELARRAAVEEELRRKEQQLAEAQLVAHIGSWEWDIVTDVVTWSDELYRIFAIDTSEFDATYEGFMARVHPEDRGPVEAGITNAFETRGRFSHDHRIVRPDGGVRWVHAEGQVIVDDAGRPLRMVGIGQDITERRRAEEALRRSEERYVDLVENANDIVYIHDLEGRLLSVNRATEHMSGYAREELLDMSIFDLLTAESAALARAMTSQKLESEGETRYELEAVARDGHHVTLEVSTKLMSEDGRPVAVQGIARDVSERRRAVRMLQAALLREQEATARLRGLDEMKNAFMEAVSHELRTPLASVIGFASTIADEELALPEEERRELLQRLVVNAEKLERLLSDLLDLDRLARGILEPNLRLTDVAELARRVAEEVDLGDRPVEIESEPAEVSVDPAKVERIVENLLANAAKHTPEGTPVWLRVRRLPYGVEIAVEDAGPGVPEAERAHVFQPFRQGSEAPTHAPGTGIGLSLVARFAELHGGRAWVTDRPGGGASFRVHLPGTPELPRS
jgi:PAS domain S-box-containing protein